MNFCYIQKIEIKQNGDTSKLYKSLSLSLFLFYLVSRKKILILEIFQRIYIHPPANLIQSLDILVPFVTDYCRNCNIVYQLEAFNDTVLSVKDLDGT